MAALIQGGLTPAIGSTVYWQAAPAIFHGYITNTDCSVIVTPDMRVAMVVVTSSLATTATG